MPHNALGALGIALDFLEDCLVMVVRNERMHPRSFGLRPLHFIPQLPTACTPPNMCAQQKNTAKNREFSRPRAWWWPLKLETLWKNGRGIPGNSTKYLNHQAQVEAARSQLFFVRGQLDDSIRALESAEALMRKSATTEASNLVQMTPDQKETFADSMLLAIGKVKIFQGRLAEGEADARRALLNRLHATGKYDPSTAQFVSGLGFILVEEGRYEDAERLIAAAIDIYRSLGVAEDSS